MEAVVKQDKTTKYPWLVACDANINPEDLKKSLWQKQLRRQEKKSTCRSKGPANELIENTYDYVVVASQSLQGTIKTMEVVDDFE